MNVHLDRYLRQMNAALIVLSAIVGAFCIVVAESALDADGPTVASKADEEPEVVIAATDDDIGSEATPGIIVQPTTDKTPPPPPSSTYDPPAGEILADATRRDSTRREAARRRGRPGADHLRS